MDVNREFPATSQWRLFLWVGLMSLALSASAQVIRPPTVYKEQPGEGKTLMTELISRRPVEDAEVLGIMKIRKPNGERYEVPVRFTTKIGQGSWRSVYESKPAGPVPAMVLVVVHFEKGPNDYMFAQAPDSASPVPEPKQLPLAQLNTPFGGSDFWALDLGMEFFHWPAQRVLKKEMRKSRSCKVVESTNPDPKPGAYKRVLSWIDSESGDLIMAEAYDLNNRLLKEFSIKGVKKVQGKWQLKEMAMRNEQTDSKTDLEYNLELKKKEPAP